MYVLYALTGISRMIRDNAFQTLKRLTNARFTNMLISGVIFQMSGVPELNLFVYSAKSTTSPVLIKKPARRSK